MNTTKITTTLGRISRSGFSPSPMAVPNTLRVRARAVGRGSRAVIVNGPTRVRLASDARIEMADGGRLLLGFGGAMGVLQADRSCAALVMRPASRLLVEGRVQIGSGTKVRVGVGASFALGDGAHLNANGLVLVAESVQIGAGSAISWGVTIMDSHLHEVTSDRSPEGRKVAPVVIGERVLVGNGSLILPGVTIGDGAVVAARSVVTRDVEPGTVVAGAPARKVASEASWT